MPDLIQPSFASGELSPRLYSRVDLSKYHTGAALLSNMFVDYRGGVNNRPGTKFVGQGKGAYGTKIRLIPFTFSTIQTYALEFGDLYMRVIKDGGYVTETAKNITGVTQANPAVVTSNAHGFSNGDWVFIAAVGGMTQLNGRTFIVAGVTANTFQLHDTLTNSNVNSTGYTAYTAGGTAARILTVVSPYSAADLALLKFTQSADTMTFTHPSYAPRNLTRSSHTAWTFSVITFAAALSPPTGLTAIAGSTAGNYVAYYVTSVDANGDESLPSVPYVTTNQVNLLKWAPVVGASYYKLYKADLGTGTVGPIK